MQFPPPRGRLKKARNMHRENVSQSPYGHKSAYPQIVGSYAPASRIERT